MKYGRYIGEIYVTDTGNYYYKIRMADGQVLDLSEIEIYRAVRHEELCIINLSVISDKVIKVISDFYSLRQYSKLADYTKSDEDSIRATYKSKLIGANPIVDKDGIVEKYQNDSSIVITDEMNKIKNCVSAHKVIFIGSKPLRKVGDDILDTVKISCDTAVIQNRCIFSNLVVENDNNIFIIAKTYYLKEKFIDIWFIPELYSLIEYKVQLNVEYLSNRYIVDFSNIDESLVKRKTIELLTHELSIASNAAIGNSLETLSSDAKVLNKCVTIISFACSMYESTNYIYKDILDIADKALELATDLSKKINFGKERVDIVSAMLFNLRNKGIN